MGNVLSGMFMDRFLKPFIVAALVVMSLAVMALTQMSGNISLPGMAAILILWGAAISAIFVGFQTWILRTAGAEAMPASAMYVAIFNAAIGTGAVLGAWILHTGSLDMVMFCAGFASVIAIIVVALIERPVASLQAA
ncbi:putative MFS family arabinose efflux permease [Oxalobacteraceae bacterium GrIS 1.11]